MEINQFKNLNRERNLSLPHTTLNQMCVLKGERKENFSLDLLLFIK